MDKQSSLANVLFGVAQGSILTTLNAVFPRYLNFIPV